MRILLIVIVPIVLFACCDKQTTQNTKTPPQYFDPKTAQNQANATILLQKQWDSLCQIQACLTGGQYVQEGNWGGEGCAFSIDKQWQNFLFTTDKKQIAAFLIQQIPDRKTTQVHTCPYDNATKGELALYCLQGIFKKNFYELSPQLDSTHQHILKKYPYEQLWIWDMQRSENQCVVLQGLWR